GMTLNVSPLGALLEIRDDAFLPEGAAPSLMDVAAAVHRLFPRGLRLRFRRAALTVEATVVRVTSVASASTAVLGCAFSVSPTRRQCDAIGIVHARGDAEGGRMYPGIAEV